MAKNTLRLEGEGPVLELVLDRPQVRNALNHALLDELLDACAAIERRRDCRAVILRGEGPDFSAGADRREGLTHGGPLGDTLARSKAGARVLRALRDLTPLTIAAVQGHAIGGGACLALACDFRVGAASARMALREASLGLYLSWGAIPLLVQLVGPSRAKAMIVFGELHEAPTLERWGLLQEVVPDEGLLDAARALARRIVAQPPLPTAMAKSAVNAAAGPLDAALSHLDAYGLTLTSQTRDAEAARRTLGTDETPEWEGE